MPFHSEPLSSVLYIGSHAKGEDDGSTIHWRNLCVASWWS
jgi:hypothetical protein